MIHFGKDNKHDSNSYNCCILRGCLVINRCCLVLDEHVEWKMKIISET